MWKFCDAAKELSQSIFFLELNTPERETITGSLWSCTQYSSLQSTLTLDGVVLNKDSNKEAAQLKKINPFTKTQKQYIRMYISYPKTPEPTTCALRGV